MSLAPSDSQNVAIVDDNTYNDGDDDSDDEDDDDDDDDDEEEALGEVAIETGLTSQHLTMRARSSTLDGEDFQEECDIGDVEARAKEVVLICLQ